MVYKCGNFNKAFFGDLASLSGILATGHENQSLLGLIYIDQYVQYNVVLH